MKELLLAIDLGTSFIKTGVYDTRGLALISFREPVRSHTEAGGIFLQDGQEIFESTLRGIRRCTSFLGEESRRISAMAFTGQMAGVIGVGEGWRDVTGWSCSLDSRYLPWADRQMLTMSTDFLSIGGTNSPLMAPKIVWFQDAFPEKASEVIRYMLISGYIAGRLGEGRVEDAAIGSSYVTWTGLCDIRSLSWSEELCEAVGISPEVLPRIVDGTAVIGQLAKTHASTLNLPAGIPLIAGAGDKISGCVGAGILETGDTIFEASSYGAISSVQQGYRENPERHDYDAIPAFGEGQYYLHRYLPGSGMTLQWFLDQFATQEGFMKMEHAIRGIPPGSDGLLALGLFNGSAMPLDGSIRGAFAGCTWQHTKAHFYRALLESYAYEIAATMDSIAHMYPEWDRRTPVRMIGGGAGSDTWMQIMADVTGNQFLRGDRDDEALLGCAMLAGRGIGVLDSLRKREITGGESRIFEPDEKAHAFYSRLSKVYEEMKANLVGTWKELQTIG